MREHELLRQDLVCLVDAQNNVHVYTESVLNKERICVFFKHTYVIVTKIGHVLGHKGNLNKFPTAKSHQPYLLLTML